MEEIPQNYDDLSEEQKRRLFNSKLVRKGLAYQRIANGLEMLKEDDPAVYNQLIAGINNRQNRVNSEDSIKEILDSMIEEVEEHTELVTEEEEDDGF